jgi:hypothetical protein
MTKIRKDVIRGIASIVRRYPARFLTGKVGSEDLAVLRRYPSFRKDSPIRLRKTCCAFYSGRYWLLEKDGEVIYYIWYKDQEEKLVVLNFSGQEAGFGM